MGNTYHHHSEERKPLRWFASPLKEDQDEKEKRRIRSPSSATESKSLISKLVFPSSLSVMRKSCVVYQLSSAMPRLRM
jgi:hypothetical protein